MAQVLQVAESPRFIYGNPMSRIPAGLGTGASDVELFISDQIEDHNLGIPLAGLRHVVNARTPERQRMVAGRQTHLAPAVALLAFQHSDELPPVVLDSVVANLSSIESATYNKFTGRRAFGKTRSALTAHPELSEVLEEYRDATNVKDSPILSFVFEEALSTSVQVIDTFARKAR